MHELNENSGCVNINYDYRGKVAIVTGAAKGLGREIALSFGKAGAKVAITDIDECAGTQVAEEIKELGSDALFIKTDVTKEAEVKAMVDTTFKAFGGIDILVNNAGVNNKNLGVPMTDLTDDDWDFTYDVNVKGVFYGCKAVYSLFSEQKYGKIVNLSSLAGKVASPALMPYSAQKASVISMTESLCEELAPLNVNVNAVCPGYIYTPIWQSAAPMVKEKMSGVLGLPKEMTPKEVFEAIVRATTPMKRPQTEKDIANTVLFLCSEEARNINGQAINVSGGATYR